MRSLSSRFLLRRGRRSRNEEGGPDRSRRRRADTRGSIADRRYLAPRRAGRPVAGHRRRPAGAASLRRSQGARDRRTGSRTASARPFDHSSRDDPRNELVVCGSAGSRQRHAPLAERDRAVRHARTHRAPRSARIRGEEGPLRGDGVLGSPSVHLSCGDGQAGGRCPRDLGPRGVEAMSPKRQQIALMVTALEIAMGTAVVAAALATGLGWAVAGLNPAAKGKNHPAAVPGATPASAAGQERIYHNRLTPIDHPAPLLADYPEFVQPVVEKTRFEAPRL